jgi:hypothetical protein
MNSRRPPKNEAERGALSPSIVASRTPIEQAILTLEDRKRHWTDDPQARKIFAYVKEKADGHPILPEKIRLLVYA